jgi:lipopolysaccharide transport system ATP-binding protein
MSSELAIRAVGLSKCYTRYERPSDRLRQMFSFGGRCFYREYWALREATFDIGHGEVIGVVGRNGAGKSTLLQLVCGTLTPTAGELEVRGRIAALLELGAGFNPDFTGRENVFLNAAILGLSQAEIAARYDEIVAFAGIGDFIDQPVKTYSSGMFVRLAFAVATSVDPDILVVDEALSVGDGSFARKSFDRIMALKDAGKTILFCSHSLYQVEALCSRVVWVDQGRIAMIGEPAAVIAAYNASLDRDFAPAPAADELPLVLTELPENNAPPPAGGARIAAVRVFADGQEGRTLALRSEESELAVEVSVLSDPALAVPSVAVGLVDDNGRAISSTGSFHDGLRLERGADGRSHIRLVFDRLPLMKGKYRLHVGLLCERGLHLYDSAANVAELEVTQRGLEQGVVVLPHRWEFADARG